MKSTKRIIAIFLLASVIFTVATFLSNGIYIPEPETHDFNLFDHTITILDTDLFTDEAGTTDKYYGYISEHFLTTCTEEATEFPISGREATDFLSSLIQFIKKLVDNILYYIETTIHIENW